MSNTVKIFPMNICSTDENAYDEVMRYYHNRSRQMLRHGWRWSGDIVRHPWGAETRMTFDGNEYASAYVFADCTGQGHYSRWISELTVPIVTHEECSDAAAFLKRKKPEVGVAIVTWLGSFFHQHWVSENNVKISQNFTPKIPLETIRDFYGDGHSRQGGQPFMAHIWEGLAILEKNNASASAKAAWCIHPILQGDTEFLSLLHKGAETLRGIDSEVIMLAMEYRAVANAHLPKHDPKIPRTSCSADVNAMLVADKVQNRKDYELYVRSHPECHNVNRLDLYFSEWFDALGITESQYEEYLKMLSV